MNAIWTFRGRRFLPLLALCCILSGLPGRARAGLLTSHLTDRTSLSANETSRSVRVVYEASNEVKDREADTNTVSRNALAAATVAALILIIPAGTPEASSVAPPEPKASSTPPPSSPPNSPPNTPPNTPPGGPNTNPTPEPGSLVLALSGSSTAFLFWMRRRRKTRRMGND